VSPSIYKQKTGREAGERGEENGGEEDRKLDINKILK
jgi:hypothetical protein